MPHYPHPLIGTAMLGGAPLGGLILGGKTAKKSGKAYMGGKEEKVKQLKKVVHNASKAKLAASLPAKTVLDLVPKKKLEKKVVSHHSKKM